MSRLGWVVICLALSLCHAAGDTTEVTSSDDLDDERVSYEGAQLLTVDASSTVIKVDILRLEDLGVIETWNEITDNSSTIDVFVSQDNEMEIKNYLRDNNVTYKIAIENIQRVIDAENPPVTGADGEDLSSRVGEPMTWNAYQSLATIYAYMDYLATTYSYCKAITIGTSIEGRPIRGMQIYIGNTNKKTQRASEPAIYIDGGMHAREWISVAAVTYIMKEIAENSGPYMTLNGFSTSWFYIFPVLNPDGYEYSRTNDRLWRKNRRKYGSKSLDDAVVDDASPDDARKKKKKKKKRSTTGVDLNRNFSYKWGGAGSSGTSWNLAYRGTSAFSEPETLAYSNFVVSELANNGLYYNAAYLSFHSYGQAITYPWSYQRIVHDNYQTFQTLGNEMAYRMSQLIQTNYTVGSSSPTFYPASGTSTDWFLAVPEFLFSYKIALRDKGRYGFLLPAHEIIPTGVEAMQAVVSLFA